MLGQDVPLELSPSLAREWLLGNGRGGSASGTVAGALVRRTQGLLVAAGPHGRMTTLLLKLDERAGTETGCFDLATNLHADGAVRPQGHQLIEDFRLDPWPTWRFRAGDAVIEKSLFTLHLHDAVAVAYRHIAGPAVRLTASPLVVARDPGGLQRPTGDAHCTPQGVPGRVRIALADDRPALTLWHNGTFLPARVWMRGLAYPQDGGAEDALVPGYVEGLVAPGRALHIVAAAEDDLFRALASEERLGVPPPKTLAECVAALEAGERQRLERWRRDTLEGADFTARQAAAAHGGPGAEAARRREPLVDERDAVALSLASALREGLARRAGRRTIVSSLPGGAEHGDDALRAVPGLVALRAFEPAREVLQGYAEYLDEGLAPERFDEHGHPVYGDAAPALWLVNAADLYARRSADGEFLSGALYPALESVMQSYRQGTRHGVRVDADGLLAAGEGERAVKSAALNALWYHALVAMAQLARLIGRKESGAFYLAWARELQKNAHDRLWDEERGCLYESLGPDGPVRGLSPSQLLAVSLPPALLAPDRAARLVATVERELATPWGLRETPGSELVSTAWLGPFVSAYLRVHQRAADAQARARGWIEAARGAGRAAGCGPGTLRVADDGVSGAEPVGDPASVLAAAELLRAWIEEVDHTAATARTEAPLAG